MQDNIWLYLIMVGVGVIGLSMLVECVIVIVRDKLGLDKEYYIINYTNELGESKTYKSNEVKIDIRTNTINFKDVKRNKNIKLKDNYTYKEVSKDEWNSIS